MNKKILKKIESFYSERNIEGVLSLLQTIPNWEKEEYSEYGRALNNLGKCEEALKYFLHKKGKDSQNPIWNYRIAFSYFFLHQWEKTIYHARKALCLEGQKQEQARYFIMESYTELEKPDRLLAFLKKYPLPENSFWNAYFGTAYNDKGQGKKAIPYLEKAVTLFSNEERSLEEKSTAKMLAGLYVAHNMEKALEKMSKKYNLADLLFDVPHYTLEEEENITEHIEKYFGKISTRIQDVNPEMLEIELLIIPPTTNHPYNTLITLGMGSRFMDGTPKDLIPEKFGFNEIFLCLPDTWDFAKDDPWPIQYLFDLAKFPFLHNSWMGAGHTLVYDNYIGNTNFSGFLVTYPYEHGMDAFQYEFEDGKTIHFYNIIPLYTEELDYKQKVGYDELEDLFEVSPMVVDSHRGNAALSTKIHLEENEFGEEEEENPNILYQ